MDYFLYAAAFFLGVAFMYLITRQVTEYFGQQPDGSYSTRMLHSWPAEPLRKEHEAFVHAIRTGETAAVTGEDGLRNLEVALRCLGEG